MLITSFVVFVCWWRELFALITRKEDGSVWCRIQCTNVWISALWIRLLIPPPPPLSPIYKLLITVGILQTFLYYFSYQSWISLYKYEMAKIPKIRFSTEVAPPRFISITRRPLFKIMDTIYEEKAYASILSSSSKLERDIIPMFLCTRQHTAIRTSTTTRIC